ncbi:MAG: helix-turn-helix domain-containing protein, partial [Candidatus Acidiferrales bacterium]
MKLWIVIYAIGAAQSALLALALWRRPADPAANRLLAAWLALVGLDLAIKSWFLAAPAVELFKAYRFVALFPFLYGSLFYLYVRALTTGRRFASRDTVHLAGFALALATTAGTFLLDAETVSAAFARHQAGDWPPPGWWYDPFLFVYSLSYVIAAVVRLHRYRQWLRQRRSNVDRLSLRWIEALAIAQLLIWCIAATHWLIRWPWIDYFLIYGAVAAWVC